ncbi:uncharacterized protein BP01DRAFT_391183 [Aspergillus saccharolyticus JOP 1030-1]|uniref:Uncharacterized protein n=1 Tax=Aspergillus saccharolyticus JOP 1030-1 TaxID=1450539 RepID=A0A318ZFN8_9EURO|nr:hypothetical protein BP01DRAFT_391183 [Aspergillus saccharolyticus JOP 1030-1]PYH46366.1 hypothetical protein BP01DRAFT_391183 [Aspergillus saccharolyticus JOP 1030-1]
MTNTTQPLAAHLDPHRPAPSLPLEDLFRASYNDIEYLKIYLSDDPTAHHHHHLLPLTLIPRIEAFQVDITNRYTEIFKHAFPHRANEPFGLALYQAEATWTNVTRLLRLLDTANWDLVRWARTAALLDLGKPDLRRRAVARGEELWQHRYTEIKTCIDAVLSRFDYKGQPLAYVGSLNHGIRGAHKGHTAINFNDFDVDLFVVHAEEWRHHLPAIRANFPAHFSNEKIFPVGTHLRELQALGEAVGRALAVELRVKVRDAGRFVGETEIVLREVDRW